MADCQITTPKKSNPSVPTSTPSIARATGTTQYSNASLAKSREAVVQDVASVDVIPLQDILGRVLPTVQPAVLHSVKAALEKSATLGEHGWECFKGENRSNKSSTNSGPLGSSTAYGPQHCRGTEDEIFLRLEIIYKAIMAAEANRDESFQPILTLLVHGNKNPTTDWPNATRPDATLHLTESSVPCVVRTGERYRIDHADVITYFELKTHDTDVNVQDDTVKLIHNVHHRFRSDPCVAHVTGVTIENTTTRFWYFDRSVVLESQPFDFMTEPQHLIHLFLALNRGSRSELGFDPTIKCVGFGPIIGPEAQPRENMERQYEFEVHDNHDDPGDCSPDRKRIKKYRSVKCIADYGRVGIRGRGTSIYSVRPLDDENAPLQVLKDSWIDVDRVIEGRVLEDIHTALHSDTEYQPYLRHLLTPDYYGFVPNDGGVRMETVSFSGWANKSSSRHSLALNDGNGRKRKLELIRDDTPQAEVGDGSAKTGLRGDPRKRCRTVFVEGPGKELGDLETLGKVFTAIKGGLSAMLAMYRAGYIHRDLSAGNIILLSQKNNQSGCYEDVGVLIDSEYAKKFPDNATQPRDARTGTWEFVASEVRDGMYMYSWIEEEEEDVPWFRNPIHDVESCWLVACWSFFHFKQPAPLLEDLKKKAILFSSRRPLLTANLPLGRIPPNLRREMALWARSIGQEYRELQAHRGDKEKLDSFDYEPIIRGAVRHVESMLRISTENYLSSWNLHPQNPVGDTRPMKRIKVDGPSSSSA